MNQRVALPPHQRLRQAPLSRSKNITALASWEQIVGGDEYLQTWDEGIPSVHIYTTYGRQLGNSEVPPNCKLLVRARWSSDSAGGSVIVDAANGLSFTLGAATRSLSIDAGFFPVDSPVIGNFGLIRPADAEVQAVIGGQGTISAKKPTLATERFVLNPGVATPAPTVQIPAMATRGKIVTTGEEPASNIDLLLYTGGNYAAPLSVQTGDDDWLECGGATFYNLLNTGAIATRAFVVWELSV